VNGVMLNRPQTLNATAFNRFGYSLRSIDCASGSVMPPAMPWMTRAGTNCVSVSLAPHRYDAPLYTMNAEINNR
jgi:hypothetical protein